MKCPERTLKEAPSEACAEASADVGCASARPGRPRFLHMFSGPAGRSDGLASALRLLGCDCEDWDIENGDDYDLADDAAYRKLRSRVIQGEFDGGMLGPPCHTPPLEIGFWGGVSPQGPPKKNRWQTYFRQCLHPN